MSATAAPADSMRLDKWLWAARFYKTRALAVEEIGRGRVLVAGASVKPAREIRPGDVVTVRRGAVARQVVVRGLSAQRGPAPVAPAVQRTGVETTRQRQGHRPGRRRR